MIPENEHRLEFVKKKNLNFFFIEGRQYFTVVSWVVLVLTV